MGRRGATHPGSHHCQRQHPSQPDVLPQWGTGWIRAPQVRVASRETDECNQPFHSTNLPTETRGSCLGAPSPEGGAAFHTGAPTGLQAGSGAWPTQGGQGWPAAGRMLDAPSSRGSPGRPPAGQASVKELQLDREGGGITVFGKDWPLGLRLNGTDFYIFKQKMNNECRH